MIPFKKQFCETLTGFPLKQYRFIAEIVTRGGPIDFYIDGPCKVDWGDGNYYKYDAGVVHGFSSTTHNATNITVVSYDHIKRVYFGDGVSYNDEYKEIHIIRAQDLEDASKLCYRLEELQKFSFFGTNKVTTFESAWEECTELIKFDGIPTTYAKTFKKAWRHCNKLVEFPALYAINCETVEHAWEGCTEMLESPELALGNCKNFDYAWRGNVKLREFPLTDVSKGETFNHTWAYCLGLRDFPTLDFRSAQSMAYAFAYNHNLKRMSALNTDNAEDFISLFEKNLRLRCLTGIDTRAQTRTTDMFKLTPSLREPTKAEQAKIELGALYKNDRPCSFDAGRSRFFVIAETNGLESTFVVEGGDVEVDWGEGTFLHYNEGIISGIPVDTHTVVIRSEEPITRIKFISDTYLEIGVKRGKDLVTCEDMCRDLTKLEIFDIEGNLANAKSYDFMLAGCTGLYSIYGEINYMYVESAKGMMQGCTSFELFDDYFEHIAMPMCKDFSFFFDGCSSLREIPKFDTRSGTNFNAFAQDCTNLICIKSLDTRQITTSSNMFDNTPNMLRPSSNEVANIKAGTLYSNGGNCGSEFMMMFKTDGTEAMLKADGPASVDWGDGTFVNYPANSNIRGSVIGSGEALITGSVTSIEFTTDNFVHVEFYAADKFTSMRYMFLNKKKLKKVKLMGSNSITDFSGAFANSGIEEFYVEGDGVKHGLNMDSMFKNCKDLTKPGHLNCMLATNFHDMFEGCINLVCIPEINTLSGRFTPLMIKCTSIVPCKKVFACWGGSTMFDNTPKLKSPNQLERDNITTRRHFVSNVCGRN